MQGKGYEKHILAILTEAGENGISVHNIATHVYNLSCTLFDRPNEQDVRRYVQQYLLKNSKSASSLIESLPQRGYYRLNTTHSADARQLVLQFSEQDTQSTDTPQTSKDFSLNLFD